MCGWGIKVDGEAHPLSAFFFRASKSSGRCSNHEPQAVTQALHSMQRSASQRNFIRAIVLASRRSDLTKRGLGLLHPGHRVEPVGRERVDAFAKHDRIVPLRIFASLVDALEPASEMIRHPSDALADARGNQCLHPCLGLVLGAGYPDPVAIPDPAVGGVGGIDLDEHVLLELGEPLVGACLLAATLVVDQPPGGEDQREMFDDPFSAKPLGVFNDIFFNFTQLTSGTPVVFLIAAFVLPRPLLLLALQ
jgi:hypothetical protein